MVGQHLIGLGAAYHQQGKLEAASLTLEEARSILVYALGPDALEVHSLHPLTPPYIPFTGAGRRRAHHVHSDLGERGGRARPTKRCASLCSCFHSIALHRITLHLSPPNQLGRASDDELLDASRNFFHDGM